MRFTNCLQGNCVFLQAIEYVKLRKPFCVNDLASQSVLNDRRDIYEILDKHKIPTPRHLYADRRAGQEVCICKRTCTFS